MTVRGHDLTPLETPPSSALALALCTQTQTSLQTLSRTTSDLFSKGAVENSILTMMVALRRNPLTPLVKSTALALTVPRAECTLEHTQLVQTLLYNVQSTSASLVTLAHFSKAKRNRVSLTKSFIFGGLYCANEYLSQLIFAAFLNKLKDLKEFQESKGSDLAFAVTAGADSESSEKLLVKARAYEHDETPLPLRYRVTCCEEDLLGPGTTMNRVAMCKIMQMTGRWAVVFKKGGKYATGIGNQLAPLQLVDRNTSENIVQCLRKVLSLPESYTQLEAEHDVVAVCTDAFGANGLAEGSQYRDAPGTKRIHLKCCVHKCNTATKRGLREFDFDISAMIGMSLALNQGMAMTKFRADGVALLRPPYLNVQFGSPGLKAARYSKAVLDLYMTHTLDPGPGHLRARLKRTIIEKFLNGEWWVTDEVQVWIVAEQPTLIPKQWDALLGYIVFWIAYALFRRAPHTFPRSRWTRMEDTLEDIGLLFHIHCILDRLYPLWAELAPALKVVPPPLPLLERGESLQKLLEDDYGQDNDQSQNANAETSVVSVAAVADSGAAPGDRGADAELRTEAAAKESSQAWAEENRKNKKLARDWISRKPLARVSIMRQLIEPQRKWMKTFLQISGKKWDKKQELCQIRTGRREYRVCILQQGTLTRQCLQQLAELVAGPAPWEVFHISSITQKNANIIFRSVAAQHAADFKLLLAPSTVLPIFMFALLLDPDTAMRAAERMVGLIENGFSCMFDVWSLAHIRIFFTKELLLGPDSIAVLTIIAIILRIDVAVIEAHHAQARRILRSRSNQTVKLLFAMLNGEVYLRNHVAQEATHTGKTPCNKYADTVTGLQPENDDNCDKKPGPTQPPKRKQRRSKKGHEKSKESETEIKKDPHDPQKEKVPEKVRKFRRKEAGGKGGAWHTFIADYHLNDFKLASASII